MEAFVVSRHSEMAKREIFLLSIPFVKLENIGIIIKYILKAAAAGTMLDFNVIKSPPLPQRLPQISRPQTYSYNKYCTLA